MKQRNNKDEHQPHLADLVGVDRIIHEPARLVIMSILSSVGKADFTFIMAQSGLSWGNVSSHMSKLEAAGYITVEKAFVDKKPQTMMKMTAAGTKAFQSYIQLMKTLIDS